MKHHKTLLLIVSLGLQLCSSLAQNAETNKDRNNEFSIVIDNIFAKSPEIYYPYYFIDGQLVFPYYDNNTIDTEIPSVGLGYKHYFGNSGIRAKLSIGSKSETIEYTCCNNEDRYNYLTASFDLGYEWLVKIKRLHIYYGADIFINHDKISSEFIQNEDNYRKTEYIYFKTGFGANPVLGAKFLIIERLSLSTEIKYIVEFYSGENTFKDSDAEEDTITKISGIKTKFGPLGQLSVNIHF